MDSEQVVTPRIERIRDFHAVQDSPTGEPALRGELCFELR